MILSDRREGGDLLFRVGETRRIEHTILGDGATYFGVSAVTCTVRNATGGVVVNAAAGTNVAGNDEGTEWVVGYLWNMAAVAAGDYTYTLTCTISTGETYLCAGTLTVEAVSGKFDAWVRQVRDWILDSTVKEAALGISRTQYRRAAAEAVSIYSRAHPRDYYLQLALTDSVFEYDVPAGWVDDQSKIVRLEYPVDDTGQPREWLLPRDYEVDHRRRKWRFTAYIPAAGETARLYYTGYHTLSDYEDTVPERDFGSVTLYAAGLALLMLANHAPSTDAPAIAGDVAVFRDKSAQYAAQGNAMIARAVAQWGGTRSLAMGADPF